MRAGPNEAWILAGTLDGEYARPELRADVCGMPYVLRIAADLAHAGATEIAVVWRAAQPAPAIDDLTADSRLRGAAVRVVTTPPSGEPGDAILVVRADRIYHRDIPKVCAAAWRSEPATFVKIDGPEYDAVVVTTRAHASELAAVASDPGGLARKLAAARTEIATAPPPYLAFTMPASDRRALRVAERRLVWSLRKQAQGIAAYWINRHISLPTTRAIMRTSILPNQVTIFCFMLALAGGIVIAQGGYLSGVLGMALVNLGSILDGVDGELARLKYRFSTTGAWLDTLADDFGNVAYVTGIAVNLDGSGVGWAIPLAAAALVSFALTQSTQYALITKVYRSGDLAAIPWAFQSNDFLTARASGFRSWLKLTLPKTLKRDFALTMFVVFALLGRLDFVLLVFSAGAIVFFLVFVAQFARHLGSIRDAFSKSRR